MLPSGVVAVSLLLLFGCAPAEKIPDIQELEAETEPPDIVMPEGAKPLADVLRSLEEQDYGPIVEVELEDDNWEIDAYKEGERVEVLIDVVSGELLAVDPPDSGMSLAEIIEKLEAQGFDTVLEVNREDDGWEIEAYRNGRAVVVLVDKDSGEIIEEE